MTITRLRAEGLLQELKAMPAMNNDDQQLSKQEAIKILAPEIRSMIKRGYTNEQVATTLTRLGLSITTATLKNYLLKSRATTKKPKKPETLVTA